MVAAAAPWLDGPTAKRFFPYLADVAFLLVFVRDAGSGRVSVRPAGRPIIDYWPGKTDQQAILLGLQTAARAAVAAGGCWRWRCFEGRHGSGCTLQECAVRHLLHARFA